MGRTMTEQAMRFRLRIAYDGTRYAGWQVQPGRETIQGVLEDAVAEITGEQQRVHCSGRTDAGVHARGQVAHVDIGTKQLAARKFARSLNGVLPDDIRIMAAARAAPDFHARFDAVQKEYRYFVWNGPTIYPDVRLYRFHERCKLDVDAMCASAEILQGEHDFAAFAANPNREIDGTVRRVDDVVVRKKGHELCMMVRGEGFLYKMVRSIAGYLLRVGRGEVTAADTSVILASKVRTARVPTAPAHGLFLWRVVYRPSGHADS